ncbi:MAG: hypothetical protein ACTTJG_07985 [Treponema sp.]
MNFRESSSIKKNPKNLSDEYNNYDKAWEGGEFYHVKSKKNTPKLHPTVRYTQKLILTIINSQFSFRKSL